MGKDTEAEILRGVTDEGLKHLSNERLIMIALSVLMGAQGVDDPELIKELQTRSLRLP